MKLELQVTSLEPAQKLKTLGVKQESLFWWRAAGVKHDEWYVGYSSRGPVKLEPCSAFTVAELGEMLPWYCSSEKHTNDWRVGFINNGTMKDVPVFSANTEADARARCLIYLLENGLIKM